MTVNKKKTRKKVNLIEEKQKLVEANLRVGSLLPIEELFRKYNTSTAGISVVDIDDLVDEYGENRIDTGNENTIYKQIRSTLF